MITSEMQLQNNSRNQRKCYNEQTHRKSSQCFRFQGKFRNVNSYAVRLVNRIWVKLYNTVNNFCFIAFYIRWRRYCQWNDSSFQLCIDVVFWRTNKVLVAVIVFTLQDVNQRNKCIVIFPWETSAAVHDTRPHSIAHHTRAVIGRLLRCVDSR